jgi:hypothetical protein
LRRINYDTLSVYFKCCAEVCDRKSREPYQLSTHWNRVGHVGTFDINAVFTFVRDDADNVSSAPFGQTNKKKLQYPELVPDQKSHESSPSAALSSSLSSIDEVILADPPMTLARYQTSSSIVLQLRLQELASLAERRRKR